MFDLNRRYKVVDESPSGSGALSYSGRGKFDS